MFLQVRNVFQKQRFMPNRHVIEQYQMLMKLPHVANVRHDRNAEFFRQQADDNETR